jgi:hypothetical protein
MIDYVQVSVSVGLDKTAGGGQLVIPEIMAADWARDIAVSYLTGWGIATSSQEAMTILREVQQGMRPVEDVIIEVPIFDNTHPELGYQSMKIALFPYDRASELPPGIIPINMINGVYGKWHEKIGTTADGLPAFEATQAALILWPNEKLGEGSGMGIFVDGTPGLTFMMGMKSGIHPDEWEFRLAAKFLAMPESAKLFKGTKVPGISYPNITQDAYALIRRGFGIK